ncbi:hypothetical protein [Streptomyces sp. NBC_00233]|uniref:hypothetical protein n=1 Tax=Streptomyces sp. NBC_00233 TaxID=2975686 RepID=UPI002250A343|nr:hypothetical protein [Streptomyces sp. NBC_00233]MCX5226283.1 hypothetical protein [Streptomyces sp. NBC_00233]
MNLPTPNRPEPVLLLVVDEGAVLFAAALTGRDEDSDRLMTLLRAIAARDLPRLRTAAAASRAALARHTDRSLDVEESDR